MATNPEESSPLLSNQGGNSTDDAANNPINNPVPSPPPPPPKQLPPSLPPPVPPHVAESYEWTADGLPLGFVGAPMSRAPWNSGLCSCLGRNDEFRSTDLEVCILGSVAPCVLYGSNAERIEAAPGSFTNHCLTYTALYLIGNSFFGWNCLAPWFSYTSRTAVRRRFNLEGSCEGLSRYCGCHGSFIEDEAQLERIETACDFATHVFCHLCSLCQEGREIRRRVAHPGFNAPPVLVMVPPMEQTMGRDQASGIFKEAWPRSSQRRP